jgi:collagenase-like PrtC family protease
VKSYSKNLFLVLIISLTSCDYENKSSKLQGRNDAKAAVAQVHKNYLKCYALNDVNKSKCTNELMIKYIKSNKQIDKKYTEAFRFESKKLGFKNFLNSQNLPCESINEGHEFVEMKGAYLVRCQQDNNYFMQFNYENIEWKIIN